MNHASRIPRIDFIQFRKKSGIFQITFVFVKKKFIGGGRDVVDKDNNGELPRLITEAGGNRGVIVDL